MSSFKGAWATSYNVFAQLHSTKARIMNIRSSVGTRSRVLGPLLHAARGAHHEHQELCWDSFEGAWATSWQCLCPISSSAAIFRQAGGAHHEHQELCWDSFQGAWATSYDVFALFAQVLGS